jgi:hypothetical protein
MIQAEGPWFGFRAVSNADTSTHETEPGCRTSRIGAALGHGAEAGRCCRPKSGCFPTN